MEHHRRDRYPAKQRLIQGGDNKRVRKLFIHLVLIVLASLLFAVSFPNLIIEKGIPLFAWIAFIPVFIVIRRTSLAASLFWGALYGYCAYGLFNYWLTVFHPLAGIIVGGIYLVYLALLFFFLKLADILFPRRAYLVQWVIWLAYEYLKTRGFLGYPYGIIGYSQWTVLPLIQIASIFGVWGVSALVVFPSAWLGSAFSNFSLFSRTEGTGDTGGTEFTEKTGKRAKRQGRKENREEIKDLPHSSLLTPHSSFLRDSVGSVISVVSVRGNFQRIPFFRREKVPLLIWAIALFAALIFGFVSLKNYDNYPKARLALIQHNTDPWRGGIDEYRRNYTILRRLSDEALAAEPKPDMVVWSETAFVPRIYWHETYRDDPSSWLLVKELLDYLAGQDVPFVIGNDDARKDPSRNPNPREDYRIDYNAVMYFERGKITQMYRKLHLVPFTEHFPYEKQLPMVYRALINADTHFWEKGTEATVFSGPGFNFSSPICFEDTFGYLSREFVRSGADLIVNLSNDAWSASLPAQNQHLSMAVFRAVENNRSMARSTSSGQTCGIDPNGRIAAMAPPFTEAWITVEIPIVKAYSIYTRYGDFLARGFMITGFVLLIFGSIRYIMNKIKKRK